MGNETRIFIESGYYFKRECHGSVLEPMRMQNTGYFVPLSSDIWRDGIGFIGSANYISKPIKYLAPNSKALLAFYIPTLDPYIQSSRSLSVSPFTFWATWISPVSSDIELVQYVEDRSGD